MVNIFDIKFINYQSIGDIAFSEILMSTSGKISISIDIYELQAVEVNILFLLTSLYCGSHSALTDANYKNAIHESYDLEVGHIVRNDSCVFLNLYGQTWQITVLGLQSLCQQLFEKCGNAFEGIDGGEMIWYTFISGFSKVHGFSISSLWAGNSEDMQKNG